MNKIILLNHINSDGIGDFYHFLDIYKALTTLEKSRDFEFISVICCKDPLVIGVRGVMEQPSHLRIILGS